MKKGDRILIVCILLLAGAAFLWIQMSSGAGEHAVVRIDGLESAEYPLNEDIEITIEGYDGGKNVLKIEDGYVSVTEADCPDKLCVKQGEIFRSGETVVCLPHRVVIEIMGGDASGVDQVAR